MHSHTCMNIANRSPSPEPQPIKVNSAGHGPSPNYRHLTSTSRHFHCSQLSGPEGHTKHWPCTLNAWVLACGPPTSTFHSDPRARMQLDVRQGGGRPASNSLLLSPVPGTCWMYISPLPHTPFLFHPSPYAHISLLTCGKSLHLSPRTLISIGPALSC